MPGILHRNGAMSAKRTFEMALRTSALGHIRTCIIVSARSCAHGKWSVRLADCLSQGDFWPAETHRDPSGDKSQHELAGVTIIIRQVISKLDAVSAVLCHDPHFKGRSACRKAVPVHRQPMSLGKVEEHSRIATCGNDPPGRRIRLEPVLFKSMSAKGQKRTAKRRGPTPAGPTAQVHLLLHS